jgi:hypothetical protein
VTLLMRALAWGGAAIASVFVVYVTGVALWHVYRELRWRRARRRINRIHAEMRGAAARRAVQ